MIYIFCDFENCTRPIHLLLLKSNSVNRVNCRQSILNRNPSQRKNVVEVMKRF